MQIVNTKVFPIPHNNNSEERVRYISLTLSLILSLLTYYIS
ncbi:hypothetical protein UF75_0910 [Desulfosporosinus sp. I2]|nr:hypothetical protein UF75_0910 [Desulfosporosinus sp. I2]